MCPAYPEPTICQGTEVGNKPAEYSRGDETRNFKRRAQGEEKETMGNTGE